MSNTTLADVLTDALVALVQMPEGAAEELAAALLKTAAELGHGGVDYYLSRASTLTREERNLQIRKSFNGTNLKAICREYQVSKTTVYRIVRNCESPIPPLKVAPHTR